MAFRLAKLVYHFLMVTIWCYALYYDVNFMPRLGIVYWTEKLVMLTNMNFVLFVAFALLAFLQAVVPCRFLQRTCDFCFFTSVFPVGMTTCLLFWGLYAVDPNLVMPPFIAALIPAWLNHVTHTLPFVNVLLDILFNQRNYPTKTHSFIASIILVLFYFGVIFYERYFFGYWLYPVLGLIPFWLFPVIYAVAVLGYYSLNMLAIFLTRIRNGSFFRDYYALGNSKHAKPNRSGKRD